MFNTVLLYAFGLFSERIYVRRKRDKDILSGNRQYRSNQVQKKSSSKKIM